MNMQFVTVLAWIFGIAATLLLLLRIIGAATYSETDKVRDMLKHQTRTFPILWPAVTAVVCWAWIITA